MPNHSAVVDILGAVVMSFSESVVLIKELVESGGNFRIEGWMSFSPRACPPDGQAGLEGLPE
jgi:hypothetical protein